MHIKILFVPDIYTITAYDSLQTDNHPIKYSIQYRQELNPLLFLS